MFKFSNMNLICILSLCILQVYCQTPTGNLSKLDDSQTSAIHDQLKEALTKAATTTRIEEGINPLPYVTETPTDGPGDNTTLAPKTTTVTPPTSPPPPNSTTTTPTPVPTTSNATTIAPPTTIAPKSTTSVAPPTTASPAPAPAPKPSRFDFPSFIAGIILTLGLSGISFIAFKFYKARTDRNYHTL